MKTLTSGKREFFCMIAFVIMTLKVLCEYSEIIIIPDALDTIIVIIYVFIVVTIAISQTYSIKEFFVLFIFGILCAYSSIVRKDSYLLISYTSILMIKNISLEKIMHIKIKTKILFISLHFVLFIIFFVFSKGSLSTNIRLGEEHIRYTMFLTQPNTAAMIPMWTIFEIIYLNYNNLTLRKLLGYSIVLFPFMIFTNSQTCIFLIVATFIIICLDKKGFKIQKKLVYIVSKYGFPFLSTLIIVLSVSYTTIITYIPILSKLLTGRIYYAYRAYGMYGWTLFGQWFETQNLDWNAYNLTSIVLDSLYAGLFLSIGVIFIIIISILFYKVSRHSDFRIQLMIFAFVIYAISEGYAINTYVSSTLLIVADYYFKGKRI